MIRWDECLLFRWCYNSLQDTSLELFEIVILTLQRLSWCLKTLATWMLAQQYVQANDKENTKVQHYWPFVRGIHQWPGGWLIKRYHLTSIGNPIVEIRRSYDRLISTLGFPILLRWHLYIESGPSGFPSQRASNARSNLCHDFFMASICKQNLVQVFNT